MDSIGSLIARLEATPRHVRRLTQGGGATATWHACHLRDIEAEGYTVRIRRLLEEEEPFLADLDGDALARERRYEEQSLAEALDAFEVARARSVSLLRGADERALERSGTFEGSGPITLRQLVDKMSEHDAGHLSELADVRRNAALAHLDANVDCYRAELETLCRIPSISASDGAAVRASAEAVARVLEAHGLEDVRVLEVEAAHPAVYAEKRAGAGLPTLLIYGHHDVQPLGELAQWTSPPFEPVERGGRLYARGSADDKGGVMAHVAAVASWLGAIGAPPCNLKLFFEGEEEIGSVNLGRFLERYRELLRADAAVLADTPNADTGIPALTYRLRGIAQVDVEVRCLERPLHSGRGGGAAPDAVGILCDLITELRKDFRGHATKPPAPILGVLPGVEADGDIERTWVEPALTVIGMDVPAIAGSANRIAPSAKARLSVRTVPGFDPRTVVERIKAIAPKQALVDARITSTAPWWVSEPAGPAVDAARRALTRGYGAEAVLIGSGGTIGFVPAFAEAFPGTPLLLMGVEDPPCNAHAENESLHLGDWLSCARSAIHLYDEIALVLG